MDKRAFFIVFAPSRTGLRTGLDGLVKAIGTDFACGEAKGYLYRLESPLATPKGAGPEFPLGRWPSFRHVTSDLSRFKIVGLSDTLSILSSPAAVSGLREGCAGFASTIKLC